MRRIKDKILFVFDSCHDRCPILTAFILSMAITIPLVFALIKGLESTGIFDNNQPTQIDRIEKRLDALERDKAGTKGVSTATRKNIDTSR